MSRQILEADRAERYDKIQDALVVMFAELELVAPSNAVGRKHAALLAKKIANAERMEAALRGPAGFPLTEARKKRKLLTLAKL